MSELDNLGSIKELYDVAIKANNRTILDDGAIIEEGETIALFNKIQLGNFREIKDSVISTGGKGNIPLVYWETTKGVIIHLVQGIFSPAQLTLMSNARVLKVSSEYQNLELPIRQLLESNEQRIITLKETPVGKIFYYNKETGEKIIPSNIVGKFVTMPAAFTDYIIDYRYQYSNNSQNFEIGERFFNGYVSLSAKSKYRNEDTGATSTVFMNFPKVKINSSINLTLGDQAMPQTGNIELIAYPEMINRKSIVGRFFFLSNDIDSDIG